MTMSVIWICLKNKVHSKVPDYTCVWNTRILHPDIETCFFRNNQTEFKWFLSQEIDLVLRDVYSAIEALGPQNDPIERCLMAQKVSLKVVLLHNGNKFPPVTLLNDANTKESYENIKDQVRKIRCVRKVTVHL
jgi:hypothetical protein